MDPESVLTFGRAESSLKVYDDRVELTAHKRVQTIAVADIAEVLTRRRPLRLILVTVQGKRLEANLGRESDIARGAIARKLSAARA